MTVFSGRWRNLRSCERLIRSSRRTLVDYGGMSSNRIHTHEVAGSSPAPPTNPHLERVFEFSTPSKSPSKACALPINAVEGFLLSRRIANCSRHTIAVYARNLGRFAQTVGTELGASTSLDVQRYLSGLSQSPIWSQACTGRHLCVSPHGSLGVGLRLNCSRIRCASATSAATGSSDSMSAAAALDHSSSRSYV